MSLLDQRHEILAAWIVAVFVALLFVGLESFLGGAQHVVWHHQTCAPAIAFVDPSDLDAVKSEGTPVLPGLSFGE